MARKRKKIKKKGRVQLDPRDVLSGKTPVTALELLRLIHRINPTSTEPDPKKVSRRYLLKARLQSLLIREFGQSLHVEVPDPQNPNLVGLRLLHFDEDACHALVHELDDDAASWARKRVDEALSQQNGAGSGSPEEPGPKDQSPNRAPLVDEAVDKELLDLPVDGLIDLGRKALEEYDYDACERYYLRALEVSGGALEPALCLLELFVDHLGAFERALDISQEFSRQTKRDKGVKAMLALSAARCGRIDQALAYVERISDPRVAEVYLLAVEHFVREGNEPYAEKALGSLKRYEDRVGGERVRGLEQEILALKARRLEDVEKDMILAWENGSSDRGLELAERILTSMPQNRKARQILREFEREERRKKISQVLREADYAEERHEFERATALLEKAIALGANPTDLSRQLEQAREMAEKQRRTTRIAHLITLWKDGQHGDALLEYIAFSKEDRLRALRQAADPHFRWIEQLISSKRTINRKRAVDAVLALGRSKAAVENGEDLHHVLREMTTHAKILQDLPEAGEVFNQAESLLKQRELQKNRLLLQKADQLLREERVDLEKATSCLADVKAGSLDQAQRKRLEELRSRLSHLEGIRILHGEYRSSVAKGDNLACRNLAQKLADQSRGPDAVQWFEKVREHSEALLREWSVVSCPIEDINPAYGSFGMKWTIANSGCRLLQDGRVLMTTCHGRWLFVRTFRPKDQKFDQGIVLRVPETLAYPYVEISGDTIWIAGNKAHLLELGLNPLTIVSWHDFSFHIKEKELIENAYVFPAKGTLWLNKRVSGDIEETIDVIDMGQGRRTRRLKVFSVPVVMNCGDCFRIAISDRDEDSIHIYSEDGRSLGDFELENPLIVTGGAPHPNGVDYIFLTHEAEENFGAVPDLVDEEDDAMDLRLEVIPDLKRLSRPIRIRDSSVELLHDMAASLDSGIIYVYFTSNRGPGSAYSLAAFRPSDGGFKPLFRVAVPRNFIFFSDEGSSRVGAMVHGDKIHSLILGETPPEFDGVDDSTQDRYYLPPFDSLWLCDVHTGTFNAEVNALYLLIGESTYLEFWEHFEEVKKSNDPDKMAAFFCALEKTFRPESSAELMTLMEERFPNHWLVLFERGKTAATEWKWEETISLLERIPDRELDEGAACHRCHILGMAYFAEGRIKKALDVWKEGARFKDGSCELDGYITYARLSLMSEKKRKRARIRDDMRRALDLHETVDRCINAKDWEGVIAAMEADHLVEPPNIQLASRLAWAYLHLDPPPGDTMFICKVLILADYCEQYAGNEFVRRQVFPPFIEKWSEERLEQTAREASKWLDGLRGWASAPAESVIPATEDRR